MNGNIGHQTSLEPLLSCSFVLKVTYLLLNWHVFADLAVKQMHSTDLALTGYIMIEIDVVVVDCGLTSHSAIFQLYSDGTDVQFPNFDLLPGTHAMDS